MTYREARTKYLSEMKSTLRELLEITNKSQVKASAEIGIPYLELNRFLTQPNKGYRDERLLLVEAWIKKTMDQLESQPPQKAPH